MTWRDSYLGTGRDSHTRTDDGSRDSASHVGHGSHHWMMIACCLPMIVIAVALVAAGVLSPGFIFLAFMCFGMMWMMMRGMDHMGSGPGSGR